jgi:glucose dehydrogenase
MRVLLRWLICLLPSGLAYAADSAPGDDWPSYGGDAGGSHFTALQQITPRCRR